MAEGPRAPRNDAEARLRAAARALFLSRGYAATSTDAICAAARVSKETLYRHFGGKDALLAAVLRDLVSSAELASGGARQADLRDDLVRHANALVTGLMRPDYIALVRLLISELPRQPEVGDLFRAVVAEQAFARTRHILENHGVARNVDVEAVSRLFVGGLLPTVLLDGLLNAGAPRTPARAVIEAHVDLILAAMGDPSGSPMSGGGTRPRSTD